MPPIPAQTEGARWTTATWAVCIVLLLASTLNYMDRQTLGNVQTRIEQEFKLNNADYGKIELGFGIAFAVGAIVFGVTADMVNVRWLYPLMIVLWSGAGAATGFSKNYEQLLVSRVLLGFFEAAHWPCALRTTQRLLAPSERTFGNSLLQSGTSIGAIITPLMIKVMVIKFDTGWRMPFLVIGGMGIVWLLGWFAVSHHVNLAPEEAHAEGKDEAGWWKDGTFLRRFAVMVLVVISINSAWQLFRAWLPKFLQQGRGYTEDHRLLITAAFNAATDVGCVLAGIATVWLATHGMRSVGLARRIVFTGCAACSACSLLIPWLPKGPLLLGVLLVIAAGMLGLFPCYYTWSQDLSRTHQGKVTGLLSTIAWLASSPIQYINGAAIDWLIAHNESLTKAGQTAWIGPFDAGLALIGCTPLIASVAVWAFWEDQDPKTTLSSST